MAVEKHEHAKKYQDKPIYSGAHFAIEIDGIGKGAEALPTLRSCEGGGVKADVVSYQMGENGDIWRQLGKPKYDDIKLSFGLSDVEGFRAWIFDFLKGHMVRKSGAIVAADHNFVERARRKFEEAIIVGLGLPKWDSSDKSQANVTITMAPEKVIYEPSSGATLQELSGTEARQRKILACNFIFSIDGYKDACARCTKIEPMEIKVKTIEHHHGNRIEAVKVPGRIEWPNLVFCIPEADAEPFRTFHNARMEGKEREGQGLGATIDFYNNAKTKVGEIQFKGVHIFNVQTEKSDTSSEDLKVVKVECSIEGILITKRSDEWVTAPK